MFSFTKREELMATFRATVTIVLSNNIEMIDRRRDQPTNVEGRFKRIIRLHRLDKLRWVSMMLQ